jgi:hypothetical protein
MAGRGGCGDELGGPPVAFEDGHDALGPHGLGGFCGSGVGGVGGASPPVNVCRGMAVDGLRTEPAASAAAGG